MSAREPKKQPPKAKRGPKPDTLVIEGDWEVAVEKAMQKKRPAEGWSDPSRKRKPKT